MLISLSPIRPIGYLLVASAFIGGGIDAGSVVLTRLTVPDQVLEAGQAAAAAVEGRQATRQNAAVAYAAASEEARPHGLKIKAKSFTLYPDGRVELTGSRTAPTLLLDRIPALRHFTHVKATTTATALPFR